MKIPTFIHREEEYLDRVAKNNTDIRLLAKDSSLEVMKQKIAKGATFYLDSSEDWQGFEFIYLLEGKLEYTGSEPPVKLEAGDYISRTEVPEESWFETRTDVTVLYTSTQPSFHLLREEIDDYLQLAQEIESTEHMNGHSKRLVRMGYEVGKRLGLSTERLADLKYAAFFHDLGKAKVPNRILEKEGELTEEEWEIMKKHNIWGREMMKGSDYLAKAGRIVEQSHERVDGDGYPNGLEADEIMLEARIVAVVDAWDAMRSDRPYRDALTKEEAIKELKQNKGTQFDADVVDTFLKVLQDKGLPEPSLEQRGKYRGKIEGLRQQRDLISQCEEVLSSRTLKEMMTQILDGVKASTPFQRGIISIYDRPIDLDNPTTAHVMDYACYGLTKGERKQLDEYKSEGVEVNLQKFDPKYKLGRSYYVPHDERRQNFQDLSEIASQLEEGETLNWHPSDSLYIPLCTETNITGQISVDDPVNGLVPTPKGLEPVESFAAIASKALEDMLQSDNSQQGQ